MHKRFNYSYIILSVVCQIDSEFKKKMLI